ncbi:MAG: hypothetical protein KAJ49_05210 [Arcobacteraceae bacterium]|nr:hypothetical protein [Arcobacteraceae bacterium]
MFYFLTFIFELLGIVAKNPIIQKIALFSFFFGLTTVTVNFFVNEVTTNLNNASSVLVIANWFGFLNALKIVFNFLITGFIVKQILAFIRS